MKSTTTTFYQINMSSYMGHNLNCCNWEKDCSRWQTVIYKWQYLGNGAIQTFIMQHRSQTGCDTSDWPGRSFFPTV